MGRYCLTGIVSVLQDEELGDGRRHNNLSVSNTTELYTYTGEDGEFYYVYFTTITKKGILWRNPGENQKGIKNRALSSLDSGQHSPSSFTSWHAWKRTIFLWHMGQLAQGLGHSGSSLKAEGIRALPLAAHHHMPAGELCSRLGSKADTAHYFCFVPQVSTFYLP